MTKANIIETIQNEEANLWLELARYDFNNKPAAATWEDEKYYIEHNVGHAEHVSQWYGVKVLMEKLGIERICDYRNEEAFQYSDAVYVRDEAARQAANRKEA